MVVVGYTCDVISMDAVAGGIILDAIPVLQECTPPCQILPGCAIQVNKVF